MDVRKYGFENLRRTQSIDWRIMVLEEGFWGVTKKEGIGGRAIRRVAEENSIYKYVETNNNKEE
ncbi:hypothetical protein MTR_7g114120 [Medicago truncatula]|uniref:Uncharacterized protein n=1 Tax=Medicago truncatula TaxID=3880 RepID=G7KZS4_MEDTR|nr:hypothetical protein MTR_7g114120 [Medicago truncatula]